jgi:hypothetical protein
VVPSVERTRPLGRPVSRPWPTLLAAAAALAVGASLVATGERAAASDEARSSTQAAEPRTARDARFVDNEDGTITDRRTGLVWEKKCSQCGGAHDVEATFYWSGDGSRATIWDWVDEINREGGAGLAGHSDWRIPNVKELFGLVDHGRIDPAVDAMLQGPDCDEGCQDVRLASCSCTRSTHYWSATTFADFPAHAFVVHFGVGLIADELKTGAFPARAVRGPR